VGRFTRGGRPRVGWKEVCIIFIYGDRDTESSGVSVAIDSIDRLVSYFKGVNLGVIHATGGDNLTVPENEAILRQLQELADII
jgi:hypothetical protein